MRLWGDAMWGIIRRDAILFVSYRSQLVAQFLGPLFNQHRYAEAWWLIALCPALGVALWLILSRDRGPDLVRHAAV